MSLAGPYHPLKVDGLLEWLAVHLGFEVVQVKPSAGWVLLILANNGGEKRKFQADHAIRGTCYRPELSRLPFLDNALLTQVSAVQGTPNLSGNYESSVAGSTLSVRSLRTLRPGAAVCVRYRV